MHGDEILGRELVLQLAVALCANWQSGNELVHLLLRHTRILLMPSMNPDGAERAFRHYASRGRRSSPSEEGRENAHRVDLNRNFPDRFGRNRESRVQEPETLAVMRWTLGGAPAVEPSTISFSGDLNNINISAALDQIFESGERTPFVLGTNLHGGALVANYPYA